MDKAKKTRSSSEMLADSETNGAPHTANGAQPDAPQQQQVNSSPLSKRQRSNDMKLTRDRELEQMLKLVPQDLVLNRSLLSDVAILKHMQLGNIIIEPFVKQHLSTSSYDVTLGQYFYRESKPEPGMGIYNPYSREHVHRVWGQVHKAEVAGEWMKRNKVELENIAQTDYIIWISPGETILAHTNEFIGGRNTVTTMMKARSSLGRNFIEVCKCAGWGDIGYVNRWTMEITNNSSHYAIPLVVGRRVAQIVFFDSDGTIRNRSYENDGKYQTSNDLEKIKAQWEPSSMLPKMFLDKVHLSFDDEIEEPMER